MPLEYSLLTVGLAIATVMGALFTMVKETNSRASKVEQQIAQFSDDKQKMIDVEIMSAAREILMKHKYRPREQLSPEDRRKFYGMVNASANLWSMKERISDLEDKATTAYIWGVVFVIAIVLATVAFAFTDVPYSQLAGLGISYLALVAGLKYFTDGILALRPIRAAEKALENLKNSTTVNELDNDVRDFLEYAHGVYLAERD